MTTDQEITRPRMRPSKKESADAPEGVLVFLSKENYTGPWPARSGQPEAESRKYPTLGPGGPVYFLSQRPSPSGRQQNRKPKKGNVCGGPRGPTTISILVFYFLASPGRAMGVGRSSWRTSGGHVAAPRSSAGCRPSLWATAAMAFDGHGPRPQGRAGP